MKLTVNLRQYFDDQADVFDTLVVPASIAVTDLFSANLISEQQELDLTEHLRAKHAIALIWDTEMIRSTHPHLTEAQAWDILRHCEEHYTAEEGLTWYMIDSIVACDYPEPEACVDSDRNNRGQQALQAYGHDDKLSDLTTLLADLMHWSEHHGRPFEVALAGARTLLPRITPNQ